jgi:hypothetical protein
LIPTNFRRREESKLNGHSGPVDVWGAETADVALDEKKVGVALHQISCAY